MNHRTSNLLSKLICNNNNHNNRSALSRVITLLESTLTSDREQADLLLDALMTMTTNMVSHNNNTQSKIAHHSVFSVGIAVRLLTGTEPIDDLVVYETLLLLALDLLCICYLFFYVNYIYNTGSSRIGEIYIY